jgi:hypothetical protein
METAAHQAPDTKPGSHPAAFREWVFSAAVSVLMLAWMAAAGARLAARLSPTMDEPTHLSAGLSGWNGGDYRQATGNLFFTQKWAAWPLARRGLRPVDPQVQQALGYDPVLVGETLVLSGGDPRDILAPARRMTLALCVLTGVLVWGWAARLGGPWAGAAAVLLFATSPVVLANGVLVTTDTGAAFWYLAALASYAWLLARPRPLSAAAAGFCAAMMLLSKFSVVAWLGGAALLLAWRLWRGRGAGRDAPLASLHVLALVVGWTTIWAFFGWNFRPGGFSYISAPPSTVLGHVVGLLDRLRVLPEPYLREILTFREMIKPRTAYLLGSFRLGGSWEYFPVAFLVKSTVAMLLALGAWFLVRRRTPGDSPSLAPLVAGAVGYAVVALATPLNIGVRHILPLFLLAAVAGGVALARLAARGRAWRAITASIALLAAIEGMSGAGQPLAWFNGLAGGPMAGWRIMVDSSLDWGGDLPDLVAWEAGLRASDRDSPVYVSLLGPPGHEHTGLAAVNMGWAFEFGPVRPGYFVFSATRLVGGPQEHYGEWNDALRREWNEKGAGAWRGPLPHDLAQLAVARMAASCRALQPSERVGPVYFVYHLDEGALGRALGRDGD